MSPRIILFFCCCFVFSLTFADPGRDACKIYGGGLKCSHLTSLYFPYDTFLSFNDDLAHFTTDMKFLQIDNSNISILQSRSFQRTPRLSHLVLSRIELQEIEQGAFDGLFRLKSADLSHNKIRHIPVDSFKQAKILSLNLNGNENLELPETGPFLSAKHMTWLTLKRCNLNELTEATFAELPSLMHLDLSENNFKKLPENLFAYLENLDFIDLSKNSFQTIDPTLFESIPSYPKRPSEVYLSENPFVCDCQIARIVAWLTQNRAVNSLSRISCRKPEIVSSNSVWFKELMKSCQDNSTTP